MEKTILLGVLAFLAFGLTLGAQVFEEDSFSTSGGPLKITFLGHGTLMLALQGKTIHVDPVPVTKDVDYAKLPKADIILITHHHGDHLNAEAVALLKKPSTDVLLAEKCAEKVTGTVLKNGDVKTVQGIRVEAVPAYNIVNMRSPGVPFHPRGEGNGYVLTLADMRLYIAGDSENTAEMKALKNIDIAFLPMNLPYTMTPEMAADAARAFRPKVLYPYHFGQTDASLLVNLLKGEKGIEVRVRKMS